MPCTDKCLKSAKLKKTLPLFHSQPSFTTSTPSTALIAGALHTAETDTLYYSLRQPNYICRVWFSWYFGVRSRKFKNNLQSSGISQSVKHVLGGGVRTLTKVAIVYTIIKPTQLRYFKVPVGDLSYGTLQYGWYKFRIATFRRYREWMGWYEIVKMGE